MARIEVTEGYFPGLPVDVLTAATTPGLRRVQVDVGQTGFWAGREFRSYREFDIPIATPLVIRTTVPVGLKGIIVQSMRLTLYQGGVALRSWRDGTPGGSWTASNVLPNNSIPDVEGYVRQTTLEHGGTLTGMTLLGDVVHVYANENGKSSTTSVGVIDGERGLAPGVYYVEIKALPGVTVNSLGTLSTIWEERPLTGT